MNRIRLWVRANVLRGRLDREMRAEMAEHIERSTARLIDRGMTPDDARRQATREFGNVQYLQEEARHARGTLWLDALAADVRFALRHFARRPLATITMFTVLAVGMSISTLLFSYVHSYAEMPPPGITREDDLVRIRGSRAWAEGGARLYRLYSEDEFLEYRKLTDHFSAVAGWTDGTVVVARDDDTGGGADTRVTFVTENYFSVLGVQPILGPGLPVHGSDDPAQAALAVIGHTMWDELFGRDPNVIGSTVTVNGVPVTVAGVAPERFIGTPGSSSLWLPLEARRMVMSDQSAEYRAVGRLRPGVSALAATAAVQVIAARAGESSDVMRALDPQADVIPLLSANSDPGFDQDVRIMWLTVGLLGLLVLLVTCTNVSALLTGLAAARRHEIAVRLSLGAARTRVIRQLLTESALLACLAGGTALGIVWLVFRSATRFIPGLPLDLGITWQATAFTFGVALTVGVLFGLSPALHATRLAIASAMRDAPARNAATGGRLQRGLVVAQIAFTQPLTVLLAAVLLFVLGSYRPQDGTDAADRMIRLSLRSASPITGSVPTERGSEQRRAEVQQLIDRIEATPGVEAAVVDWRWAPRDLGSYVAHADDRIDDVTHSAIPLSGGMAATGWFDMMGIPLVRGREFAHGDNGSFDSGTGDVAVIIGADLARRLWGSADPLGRRLQPASDTTAIANALVVVGVIDDPASESRQADGDYRVYLPPDTNRASLAMMIRTTAAAQALLPTLRTVVRDEMPGMVANIRTLAEVEDENRRRFRIITASLSTAGVMALLLSAIGLYAVIAFSVGQRTREIAVRLAVGASGRQIVRKFVGDGLRLSVLGLVFGLPLSLIGLRALMMSQDEIPPVPLPSVTLLATLGVVVVATAAVWIPARRAAAVDPAVTLRRE